MARKMLIDAAHPEETRVALLDEKGLLVDYEFKSSTKETVKGNIYLAKIMRVEPSLQAAFVDYGGGRHGFLAFGEIHPDYFRIPISDREALKAELSAGPDALSSEDEASEGASLSDQEAQGNDANLAVPTPTEVSSLGGDLPPLEEEDDLVRRPSLHRRYKIQEVVQKNQIILVQVVKEERGTKGAALTTYLSLAGRYCVLMPNSPRSGGISRKIANPADRKRLRQVLEAFNVPEGMGLIIRTAGKDRTKTELKRDGQYLMRLWNSIREKTLSSIAPFLVHSEEDLVKRAVRDLYSKDVDAIFVAGEEGYKAAKDFMKSLLPSHSKKVQRYKSERALLFHEYGVERQIDNMYEPEVRLPSGGSIVIHPTEALVSIDINSGKATRERHIEETATKTNLEAATEIARQVRLRDLAGLIVIDFIDMDEPRNVAAVEKRLRDVFRDDRARVQLGRISPFGLLEMSRQRLAPSLLETSAKPCPHCRATGYVRSTESLALSALRLLEQEGLKNSGGMLQLTLPSEVLLYVMNQKRATLAEVEARHQVRVVFEASKELSYQCVVSVIMPASGGVVATPVAEQKNVPPQEPVVREEESTPQPRQRGQDQNRNSNGRNNKKQRRDQDKRGERRRDEGAEVKSADAVSTPQEEKPAPKERQPLTPIPQEGEGAVPDTLNADSTQGENSASKKRRLRRRSGRRGGRREKPVGDETASVSSEDKAATTSGENAASSPVSSNASPSAATEPVYREGDDGSSDASREKTWWKRLLDT
ncbi:MAG: Rne/Rng family ribonuclease [Alphaproteobacteria bacterium]|nr:Rne/Rng family ribonuclease [Alphaproteobacteria bacterium]